MKVRSDFVSNSSSCSFIIALSKEYDVDTFCKDLAETCSNPKAEYHNKDIVKRNKRILDFCLNNYELAFLGTWKLRTDEIVKSKEDIIGLYVDDNMTPDEKKMMLEEGERHWKYELECIEKAKDPNCNPYLKKMIEHNFLDQESKIHVFNDVFVGLNAVDSNTMEYEFNRYGYKNDDDKKIVEFRVKKLKQLAEAAAAHESGKHFSMPNVKCYAITMGTVKNTRDLIAAGMDITLEEHEDLDKLQKRLEAGEKIFRVHIGHSGEGYGNYEIHCEDDAKGLDDLAIEILDAEPM